MTWLSDQVALAIGVAYNVVPCATLRHGSD